MIANGQFSLFERGVNFPPYSSCGFLNWRPDFCAPSNLESGKNIRAFGYRLRVKAISNGDLDSRLVGGGVVEREFAFKPSFDEYLKAMESVKTGQGKKEVGKFTGPEVKDDSEGRNVRFKGFANPEYMWKIRKKGDTDQNEIVNDELDYKDREIRGPGVRLGGKGSSSGRNVRRKVRGATGEKRQLNDRTFRMTTELEDLYQRKAKMTQSVQESHIGDIKSKRTNGMEEEFAYGKQLTKVLGRKNTKGERLGDRENKIRVTWNDVPIDRGVNKVIVQKSGFPSRSNLTFLGKGSRGRDDGMEVERSAFKSLAESKDALARPRTSRMEMEERIQKLAK